MVHMRFMTTILTAGNAPTVLENLTSLLSTSPPSLVGSALNPDRRARRSLAVARPRPAFGSGLRRGRRGGNGQGGGADAAVWRRGCAGVSFRGEGQRPRWGVFFLSLISP